MSTPITLLPGTLPWDCWPADVQTAYETMVNLIVGSLDQEFPGIVVGADEPAAEYQDRVWFRTTDLQWYSYVNGNWVRPYGTPASGSERRLWVGLETDLQTYDGGSPGVVGPATGPFWEVDHNFDARFLLGPGILPSTTAIAVNATGGEETHVLTKAELAIHNHLLVNSQKASGSLNLSGSNFLCEARYDSQYTLLAADTAPTTPNVALSGDAGSDTAHNNMPPYYGVFVIKRTARTLILA